MSVECFIEAIGECFTVIIRSHNNFNCDVDEIPGCIRGAINAFKELQTHAQTLEQAQQICGEKAQCLSRIIVSLAKIAREYRNIWEDVDDIISSEFP